MSVWGAACVDVWMCEGIRERKILGEPLPIPCYLHLLLPLVSIPDEITAEKCTVSGRFPLTGPWWRVKVQVVKPTPRSKIYQAQGFPSYYLQSDMSPPGQKNICSLFLKDCGYERRDDFLKWVEKVSSFKNLNFENLRETLRNFDRQTGQKNKKQSTQNEQDAVRFPVEKSCKYDFY